MKEFNDDFKTKLYESIKNIEDNSVVEIVAIIRQQSEKYKDVGMMYAAIVTALVFTVLMFVPFDIDAYLIYFITLVTYAVVYLGIMLVPAFLKMLIGEKRIQKSTEIMSRALFQKGGIRFTQKRIGVMIFVSYLEKKVILIPDRGVIEALPQEELSKIETDFQNIFVSSNISEAFLNVLNSTKEIFNKYLPPVENDINELPDNLKIEL